MLTLLIDTREQRPLKFKEGKIFTEIKSECLPYGDYACELDGFRFPLFFERKSLGDLFGN